MKKVEIDNDVHRAIEGDRLAFDETINDILRRMLGIDARPQGAERPAAARLPRSSGAYSTVVGNDVVEANSLKELLRRVILLSDKRQPGFLRDLSKVTTARGRRIIARAPENLYPPAAPHLIRFAEKLDGTWWFDTNVGRNQVLARLKIVAGLRHLNALPTLRKRSEKTTLLLSDLVEAT
jgi:hypothetical protein